MSDSATLETPLLVNRKHIPFALDRGIGGQR